MRDYRIGLYEKSMPNELSFAHKAEAARTAGFDFLEMSVDETDDKLDRLRWTERDTRDVLAACSDQGLHIESICLSGHRRFPIGSELWAQQGMDIMRRCIELAARMGVKTIQLAGYDVYYDEQSTQRTRERFMENLHQSALFASQYAVILALETMENDFMNTIAKAMDYVRAIRSPYLQVYPDIGNVTNAGVDVIADIEAGSGHIAAAHLKETVPGKFREIPYGTGHVNFPPAIAKLREQGVRRFLAEFWYVNNPDWQDVMAYNRRFLDQQFGIAEK